MTAFRNIDAERAWTGHLRALQTFKRAFEIDCKGDRETFKRVYGWTDDTITTALARIAGESQ